jgi:hypothetical protein
MLIRKPPGHALVIGVVEGRIELALCNNRWGRWCLAHATGHAKRQEPQANDSEDFIHMMIPPKGRRLSFKMHCIIKLVLKSHSQTKTHPENLNGILRSFRPAENGSDRGIFSPVQPLLS